VFFVLLLFFFFSITFTSPSKSNLPTHLSRTRGLGWLRLWRGLLHREFVQLARNTEPALIWSRSLCSTSICYLSFVTQGRCQFYFLFTSFFKISPLSSLLIFPPYLMYITNIQYIPCLRALCGWTTFFITREGTLFAEYSPRKAPAVAVRPGFLGQ
jgi:hypothetical protein